MSDEVFGKVVREAWALVTNFDYEAPFRGVRSQMDCPAHRRRGASVDQKIEHDLPNALDADGRHSMKIVDPCDLKPLSRGFRFDEQPEIVDIDRAQRIVGGPPPVRHESSNP